MKHLERGAARRECSWDDLVAVAVAIAAASVEADASQAVSREVAATAGAVVLAGASAMVAARRFVRVGPMAGEAAASGPSWLA